MLHCGLLGCVPLMWKRRRVGKAKRAHQRPQLGGHGAQKRDFAHPTRNCGRSKSALIAAFVVLSGSAVATAACAQAPDKALDQPSASAPSATIAEYQRKLGAYTQARRKFDDEAAAYWAAVTQKRRLRSAKRREREEIGLDDYVLTQPPVYAGPPAPTPPPFLGRPGTPTPPRKYIPVVADFLNSAQEYFDFAPQRPRSEMEFKRAYARLALDASLTKEQIVRIYVFETGGNGTHDAQAGLEYSSHGRAVSPALGYNQLLNTNSVELLAERGDEFVAALKTRAALLDGEARRALERKVDILRQMMKFCRTVPDDWNAHDALANTPQGLGVHALLLDVDVGPLLQVQKLLDSVTFARQRGLKAPLRAAELEMMNLTGDGNGLDIIMMPAAVRERVPTANFFMQASYERNPVAIRNNVVAKLMAATEATMDRGMNLPGARELAAAATR